MKVELRKAMKKSNDYVWYFNKTIEFLNNIFSIEKEIYWSKKCHLKRLIIDKFGSESLSALEMDDSYALYENLDLRNLIKYFQVITGVVLREVGTSILALGDCLILSDLVDISTRIKSMNLVSEAKGMELTQLATHTSGSEVFFRIVFFFSLSFFFIEFFVFYCDIFRLTS